jgi:Tol biopolymer transport system component
VSASVTVGDLLTRRRFLGASISPNGRFVSYAVVQADILANSYQSVLMLAPTAQPSHTRTLGNAGRPRWNYVGEFFQEDPQWSPDTKWVTYTRQQHGARQIWRWSVTNGQADQLTHSKLDVLNYRWLPHGRAIVYSTRSDLPNAEGPRTSDALLFQDTTLGVYGLPLLDRDAVASPRTMLWVYDLERRRSRLPTPGESALFANVFTSQFQGGTKSDPRWDPRWSPDGRFVAESESVQQDDKVISDVNYLV